MMQWLTAEKLSEFHFFVEDENASALVAERNNVTLGKAPKNTLSVLVTGSGFMINSHSALKAELRNFLCEKKTPIIVSAVALSRFRIVSGNGLSSVACDVFGIFPAAKGTTLKG